MTRGRLAVGNGMPPAVTRIDHPIIVIFDTEAVRLIFQVIARSGATKQSKMPCARWAGLPRRQAAARNDSGDVTQSFGYSNANTRFQSVFMLTTVQARDFASSMSGWPNVPTLVSGSPFAGP